VAFEIARPDEGGTFTGPAAIRQYSSQGNYHHTVEPLSVVERDGKTIVTEKVSGDFPNSLVNLELIFRLEGDKITSLEIR
jgi:hypothetical protein